MICKKWGLNDMGKEGKAFFRDCRESTLGVAVFAEFDFQWYDITARHE